MYVFDRRKKEAAEAASHLLNKLYSITNIYGLAPRIVPVCILLIVNNYSAFQPSRFE